MAELNEHMKQVMGIKPKPKPKKNYAKIFVWTTMVAIIVVIWTLIYNLIF